MYKPSFILAGLIPVVSLAADPTKEQLDFFEQKVRPIFANNCYTCHSIEQGKSKGGMTLDTADGARKGGETGKGITPGDPAKSMIYHAISYKDSELQMPPASKGGKLKDDQIAIIEQWIKMGAPDPRKEAAKKAKLTGLTDQARAHWAYQPVKNWKTIEVPKPKNSAWVSTPIDAFILAKLEEKNMLPSPRTEKETLLRRAYYDLIGMPPSPAQVQAFIADQTPGAWDKVIEQLLASPHYGERWGRHWLDSARYADTVGGDANTNNGRTDYRYAHAWTYRDYVIRALNEDKPYNEFITEQLAADYLYPLKPAGTAVAKKAEPAPEPPKPTKPEPKPDPLNKKTASAIPLAEILEAPAPTAAKTAPAPAAKPAPAKTETPAIEPAMMAGGDMMMMGGGASGAGGPTMEGNPNLAALGFLTVGERFNNNNDIINDRIDVVTKAFVGLTVACARCHDHMFDPISTKDYYALHGVFASINEPAEKPLISSPDKAARADYEQKKKAVEEENRNIYYREVEHWLGLFQAKPQYYLKAALLRDDRSEKAQQERDAMLKSEQLDGVLANYYGRVLNKDNRVFGPLFELREVKKSEWDTHSPLVLKYIAGEKKYNPIVLRELIAAKPGSMEQAIGVYNSLLVRLAPKLTGLVAAYRDAKTDRGPEGISNDELEIINGAFSLTPAPKADTNWVRTATNGWPVQFTGRAKFVFAKLNDLDLTHPGAPARAMVVKDKERPQNSPVLIRGQAGVPGEMVQRHFLEILSPGHKAEPFRQGSGRLELAKAITSKDNPLTARVVVNRVWMHHFGEGFVRTPDDLGVMSEEPRHPELVDYLASWFTDEKGGNWSLKNLHRFIMRSRAYQASSNGRKEYEAIDPDNRLLWRANVRRLDFEAVRDSMLVFSGRLDPKVGGQPVNITDEPYTYRRSIYGYIDRGNVPELMGHFDFSDPDMPNSKRATTIVPQQALFLMNSPMAVDVARRVAARPEFKMAKDDQARIFAIYNILFQRQPKPGEIAYGYGFVKQELKKQPEVDALAPELAKKTADVAKRIEERKKRDNDAMRPVQNSGEVIERKPLTSWESYVHALLFCNESSYVN